MNITEYMEKNNHEQLVIRVDKELGLKAIIAIHDTTLGPALGSPQMASFTSDEEAISQAIRSSRAYTYKCAAAGLPLGGGRLVVIGDPREKSEALVRSIGRLVESLGGHYIIAWGGPGFTADDRDLLRRETSHIVGLPTALGGGGDPAGPTGYGVFLGMKACARQVFGSDSLRGRMVAIQGFGRVGSALAKYLNEEKVLMIVGDINVEAADNARNRFGAKLIDPDAIYGVKCDIFSPCARGTGILNEKTIPRLNCKIIAGSANAQLENEERDSQELQRRGILYAPDYVINAGGVINLYSEIGGYKQELARARTEQIPLALEKVFTLAKTEGITTKRAADRLVEDRLQQVKTINRTHSERQHSV